MASWHIPVHDSSTSDDFFEDPFDENLELTFPPLRYFPMFYDQANGKDTRVKPLRRESSRERERLYRELVGHEPYRPLRQQNVLNQARSFQVKLDVKHYKPEEITLKVDGQVLVVSGKHFNESETGFESSEFQRRYNIPEDVNTHSLTSNISQGGVLCIEAAKTPLTSSTDESSAIVSKEKFQFTLDVTGYTPDEITIRVNGSDIVVHGETKDEHIDAQSVHHQQFTRHIKLPSDVNADALSSRYTKDGKITIEASRGSAAPTRTLEIKKE